jgi:hypothetical protein
LRQLTQEEFDNRITLRTIKNGFSRTFYHIAWGLIKNDLIAIFVYLLLLF